MYISITAREPPIFPSHVLQLNSKFIEANMNAMAKRRR